MPEGLLKSAALPVPSVLPATKGEPAKVVTTPAGVIFRIVLLDESATNTLPDPSTATPAGLMNWAAVPVPSIVP